MPDTLSGTIRIERPASHVDSRYGEAEMISSRHRVEVTGLFVTGFTIICDTPLSFGECFVISLPYIGQHRAAVNRMNNARNGEYGCLFETPIRPIDIQNAQAVPEPEDVSAMRRRIRETVARSEAEAEAAQAAEPPSLKMRLLDRISRMGLRRD